MIEGKHAGGRLAGRKEVEKREGIYLWNQSVCYECYANICGFIFNILSQFTQRITGLLTTAAFQTDYFRNNSPVMLRPSFFLFFFRLAY